MASNSQASLITDGYAVPTVNNSFTSNWCDKRSATRIALSLTFTSTSSTSPDGYAHIEVSNAPENYNAVSGSGPLIVQGQTQPVDVNTYPGSTTALISAVGTYTWDINTACRWVRVVFVGSGAAVAGLQAYVFASVPFESA
jgi:hypothetical protein